MQQDNRLQQAISAARAGRELTARDMFLDIVRDQPQNELAWMWLAGLLDDLDECIHACERTRASILVN
jgi:Tfp pilus assembly protein PilF